MKNILNMDNLKNWLLNKEYYALQITLLLLLFILSVATSQLPITLAQGENEQGGAGAFEITVTTEPVEGGTVSGGGSYDEGSEARLMAMASEGYEFSGWFEDGKLISVETELVGENKQELETTEGAFDLMQYDDVGSLSTQTIPRIGGFVVIDGIFTVGEEIEANISQLSYEPDLAIADDLKYQWKRDGKEISGAVWPKYYLTLSDVGKQITVLVSGDEVKITGHVESDPTPLIEGVDALPGTYTNPPDIVSSAFHVQFAGGNGTAADPYLVATADQLNQVRYNLDAHYKQTANINLGVAPWNSGAGWVPIGNKAYQFTGSFDGNGFAISNLTINESNLNYGGLFGYASGTSQLIKIRMLNVSVTGNYYIGGLIGKSEGNIISCQTAGLVNGVERVGGMIGKYSPHWSSDPIIFKDSSSEATVRGNRAVGGLVGYIDGHNIDGSIEKLSASGSVTGVNIQGVEWSTSVCIGGLIGEFFLDNIKNSYATGNVSGHYAIGGLIGWVGMSASKIESCYASGDVTSNATQGYGGSGGLVGFAFCDTIQNCFASGSVSGEGYKGGLVGNLNLGLILNCYATGKVEGAGTYVGGLVGKYEDSVVNSYYDRQTTGQNDTGKGIPKTTAEMQAGTPSTDIYTNWSEEAWTFAPTNQYPLITSLSTGSIQVFIEPQAAIDAGAKWRLTQGHDTEWKDSGVIITGLAPGTYTITFKEISGLSSPADIGLGLEEGENIRIEGP